MDFALNQESAAAVPAAEKAVVGVAAEWPVFRRPEPDRRPVASVGAERVVVVMNRYPRASVDKRFGATAA